MPFLFLGAACLVMAAVFRWSDPAPGNTLPLWILLVVIGIVAIVGGLVGALVRGDEEEAPAPRPRLPRPAPEARASRAPEPRPRTTPPPPVRAPTPAPPVVARPSPREAIPWETSPPLFDSDFLGARAVPRPPAPGTMSSADSPPPSVGRPFPPSPLARPLFETEPTGRDEVMRSLEELSQYLQSPRPVRRSEIVPEPPTPPAEQICAGCETGIARDDAAGSCRSCGLALCSPCWETSEKVANPGLCPTCALLDEPAGRARPAGPRSAL
jgi:hypothetical protein